MSFISPTLLHVDVPSSTIMGPSIDTEDEEESDDDDDLSANLAEMRCFTQEQRDQGIEYWIVELCRSWYSPDVNNAILERRVAKEARRIFSTQFAGATMLSTLQDLSFFFDFCIRHGWIRQGVETCFHLESLIYEHEISHLPEDERMSLPPLMKGLALTRLLLFRGYYSSGLVVLKRMVSHYNHTYEYATIILARLDNVPLRSFTQENQVKHQDATKRLRTHLHLDPEGRLIFLENILRYLWRFSPESRTHFELYLKYALAIMPLQSFVALGMECVAEIGLQPFLLGYTKRLNMSRSSIRILFAHRDSSPRASLFPSSPPLSIHTGLNFFFFLSLFFLCFFLCLAFIYLFLIFFLSFFLFSLLLTINSLHLFFFLSPPKNGHPHRIQLPSLLSILAPLLCRYPFEFR